MRRLRTLLLCLALVATASAIHPASAEPLPQGCAGSALITTSKTLSFSGTPVTTGFTVNWPDGLSCPSLSGTVTANCISWIGSGGSAVNQRFQLSGQGTTLVLSGGIRGVIELHYEGIPCNGGSRFFKGPGSLTWG